MTILETDRLLFRLHKPADMDAYCAMEMDANVRRYVGGRPRTREEAEKRFAGTLQPITDCLGMWATVLKPRGIYIGRCGIYPHFNTDGEAIHGEASLGLYIAHEYWGQGFATEAGRAFMNFGFNELGLNSIVTMIDRRNAASVHIVEKLGFELVREEIVGERGFYHYKVARMPRG
jgi:ribosomal-protein-alanine N-acetyltransferase